jgi:hypothetical protein
MFDDAYNNLDLEIEIQILHKIKSRKAEYRKEEKRYIWKDDDRRFNRIEIKLTKETDQLPLVFFRVKKIGNYLTQDSYLGYFTIDIRSKLNLKNNRDVNPERIYLRKCETTLKNFEDKSNYLGEILFAFNCFTTKDEDSSRDLKRKRLPDFQSYKKCKLFSKIYIGKYFPSSSRYDNTNKNSNSDDKVFCRIDFYNETAQTQKQDLCANPRFGDEPLSLTAMLNEEVEYSENIKLSAICTNRHNDYTEEIIGTFEIPVESVNFYNSEKGLEKDLYNKATWYKLINSKYEVVCWVLARFMLIQTSQKVNFTKYNIDPVFDKRLSYHIFIFLIGVRNIQVDENEKINSKYINLNYFDLLEKDRNKNKYKRLGKMDKKFSNTGNSKYNFNVLKVKKRKINMKKMLFYLLSLNINSFLLFYFFIIFIFLFSFNINK